MNKKSISYSIGLLASIGSIILWILFAFLNPYTHEPVARDVLLNTLLTLCLPACLALLATIIRRARFMLIAFVWSLPISLYTAMTPSIFKWFGLTCLLYLIAGLLMINKNKQRQNKNSSEALKDDLK
ncbi:MAG: hypothetical protein ACE3L7_09495 [Candidatus Pristimantibacillus sp.]